jgi:hypothetical protein
MSLIFDSLKQGNLGEAAHFAILGLKTAFIDGFNGLAAMLPDYLQPTIDVIRSIGELIGEGQWSTIADGLVAAFDWATNTVKANWDIWLQNMSDKLYEVIGEVWGWWSGKVTEMTNKLLGTEEKEMQVRLNQEEMDKAISSVAKLKQLKEAMLEEKEKPMSAEENQMLNKNLNTVDKELAAAERRLEWLRGTGMGGEANRPGEILGREDSTRRADTSVADREAARLRQQAAADAAAARFGSVIGLSVEDRTERDEMRAEVAKLLRSRDDAYTERNALVAALSKVFPASLERHDATDTSWDPEWLTIVAIDLPTGQATWHIHDRERSMFAHLSPRSGYAWDGHTTTEKYARIAALKAADGGEVTP